VDEMEGFEEFAGNVGKQIASEGLLHRIAIQF
jgi:hypothetical protein